MGGCVSSNHGLPRNRSLDKCREIKESEKCALTLIYKDIAKRNTYEKIDFENFLLFFRKNGLWGGTLFKQFDIDQSDLLAEDEFITGIVKIFKSSEEKKAKLLFSHFAKNKIEDSIEGILYKDFVRMLYNYPKDDLREILHDQHFFETEIKGKLVNMNNPYTTVSRIPEKEEAILSYEDHNEPGEDKEFDHFRRSNQQGVQALHKQFNSSLTFFLYDKKLNVKMTSIHALVRKFAEMIFKEFGINTMTGRIQEKDFIDWVTRHPVLYRNYYGGFHKEIWELSEDGKMRYLFLKPQNQSSGLYFEEKQNIKKKKVGLLYVKSFLILHEPEKKEEVFKIIYLEGLDVTKIKDSNNCHGIKISHRNNIYPEKKIFFINEAKALEWAEALKFYQSITLYQKYSVGKRIGAGKFSVVYKCEEIDTGKVCALKQIETYKLSDEAKMIISNESKILGALDHDTIPRFENFFSTKTHNYIVMEYLNGTDLAQYIRQKGKLSEIEAVPIIKEILRAGIYMQEFGIVHRDLKPDNIMLIFNREKILKPTVKILDFGFANYVENIKNAPQECKAVGTPNYIAPELIRGDTVTEKIDNFSIGSITYFMLSGTLPFLGDTLEEIFQKTKSIDFDLYNQTWKKISNNAKDFIKKLMTGSAETRMDLRTARKHAWIKDTIIEEQVGREAEKKETKKKKYYEVY